MNAAAMFASISGKRRRPRSVTDPAVGISYLRVSTEKQELGPGAQRAAITAWAKNAGVRIVAEFVDRGVGGAADLDHRPGLMAAIDSLTEHSAGIFVVAKRDRLSRDMVLGGLIERLIERAGGRVLSADGTSDAAGAEGQLLRGVVDLFSQFERALIRSRTKAALATKKARGERVGSVPWGKQLAGDGVHLVANSEEEAVVAAAHRLHSRGRSLREIAALLEKRGMKARSGGRIWPETVRALLRASR